MSETNTRNANESEIKICPVCGKEHEIFCCPFGCDGAVNIHESEQKAHFLAHVCKGENLSVWIKYVSVFTEEHSTREEAIAAWNTRAECASLTRLRENQAKLIETLELVSASLEYLMSNYDLRGVVFNSVRNIQTKILATVEAEKSK